ncbi:MAG: response regulator transcription factor [Chloroflexi bacterium]|nr:response regulator transcription factor [Chloroflexota bacterium]
MEESIRIVLGEDHALVREGTRRILEQHPDLKVVGEAGDGRQIIQLVEGLQPDVAILDMRMPGLSGVEVARYIKAHHAQTKVLILTAYDDEEFIVASMAAGAEGYLLKTARANELVEAVRTVQRGETVLHPAIASKVARLWARGKVSAETTTTEQLSPREQEVLELSAMGMRNKMIADKLGISVRTVEGHFNGILSKLRVSSRVEAVLYAVSRGLVTPHEEER